MSNALDKDVSVQVEILYPAIVDQLKDMIMYVNNDANYVRLMKDSNLDNCRRNYEKYQRIVIGDE
jgi:hypothetical protein